MIEKEYYQLLELYTLEEILERAGITPEEVLAMLDEAGLLNVDVTPL